MSTMRVIYKNGDWFDGERGFKETGFPFPHETKGTHHFTVIDGSEIFKSYKGKEIAVPIDQVLFFVLYA